MTLKREHFGRTSDGRQIEKFTISNNRGLTVNLMNWGATLMSVFMLDASGLSAAITLAFETPEEYERKHKYFGVTVGRFANRIARGCFTLDGTHYTLARNNRENHLHGGVVGFDRVLWEAKTFEGFGHAGVSMKYTSRDGEEGYPGELDVTVTFALTEENELTFQYDARTNRPTPVNLTNHAYWNLAGVRAGSIEPQILQLACPWYLPVTDDLIPTGEVRSVEGTAMDFTAPKPIGRDLGEVKSGYDHCYIREWTGRVLDLVATVRDPWSGRRMDIWTTMPAIQLYTGNFLEGVEDSSGKLYLRHAAFCLETEYYPDSVNHPEFPSCILRPGELYHHVTRHQFSITSPEVP